MYEQVFLKNLIIGWVVITFVLGNNSLIHRMHSRRDAELQESAEKTIFSRILTNKGTASCDCKKKTVFETELNILMVLIRINLAFIVSIRVSLNQLILAYCIILISYWIWVLRKLTYQIWLGISPIHCRMFLVKLESLNLKVASW